MRTCPKCGYNPNELTPSELAVLRELATGEGEKEVARRLHISPKTVNAHLYNMRKKTKTHNVLQLVIFGLRQGLIEIPTPLAAADKTSSSVAEQNK